MHSLEGLIFLLVIVFYILRGIYQGLRRFFGMVRQALAPAQRLTAEEVRRSALEQMRQPTASQQAGTRAAPPQQRARRPEAGGPAVTDPATSDRFRTQMAQIEAQELTGRAEALPDAGRTEDTLPLFRGGDDLVRAVIFQEILAKPLSQRRSAMPYKNQRPDPPQ